MVLQQIVLVLGLQEPVEDVYLDGGSFGSGLCLGRGAGTGQGQLGPRQVEHRP